MTQQKYMRPGLEFAVGKAIEELGKLQAASFGCDARSRTCAARSTTSKRKWKFYVEGQITRAKQGTLMQELTRRAVVLTGMAAACAAALQTTVIAAVQSAPVAEMLFTTDEPWGIFVRGHVTPDVFNKAAVSLMESDNDLLDNAEGWAFDREYDDDGNSTIKQIGDAGFRFMRVIRENDPEQGTVYAQCKPDAPGAFPVTVIRY